MTAYFDQCRRDISDAMRGEGDRWDALRAIDENMVRDCSLAVMVLGERFPAHLRLAAWRCMGDMSIASWGHEQPDEGAMVYGIEDEGDYGRCLLSLVTRLHTIWHELARCDRQIGDDPRTPVNDLLQDAEQARAALRNVEKKAK